MENQKKRKQDGEEKANLERKNEKEKKSINKYCMKKSSNLRKLTLFEICCVYSFFLKKATVCSGYTENMLYIYHLK